MKSFFSFALLIFSLSLFAQDSFEEGVVMKVNNRKVYSSEFKNVYTKNASILDEEDKMTVDDYFELFKNYQLKLEAALDQKLDQDSIFLKEYKKYYKQLADNYIANGKVTEQMIEETYQRLVNEVKARHILINASDNATDEEKAKALETAKEIKLKLQNGADFEALAQEYSDDPSAKTNGGNIGWFKAFKMVYPFENAAYNLNVGEISDPVKTRFGYHIIQKTDERKSTGKLQVAHIMVRMQQSDTLKTPEQHINEIYKKLNNGSDFKDLAKQFSQDENTAENGGIMPVFELGNLNSPVFEEKAFALQQDGAVSEPFQTRFGWHIVKRISTEALDSFEEQREFLKKRIKTSERSKLLNNRIQENIEQLYSVSKNNEAVSYIVYIATEDILKSQWQLPEDEQIPNNIFLQIEDESHSWLDLAKYVEKQQRAAKTNASKKAIVQDLANQFVYGKLVEYHKKRLPEIDQEFALTIQEYKNGLLLYEVMERTIWNPAKNDSIALKEYYKANKDEFKSKETIELEIASFSKKKEARKFLKKVSDTEDFSLKANEIEDVIFQEKDVKAVHSPAISDKLKLNNGVSKIYKHNGQFVIYNIFSVNPVRQLDYDEVKGRVISSYQNQLEAQWLEGLLTKFELEVNQKELNRLRKEFE
ncbi:peptidylprolyl isomerase [Psychroflexus salis]|uniref:Peptidyl-prolyl cis-trans isomerase n=1 Tax=Psychroflexus salis TaxID=1526574 RepID=A0A917E6C3_9FLAO|nr:peptidylprolyl isomerase [Psychroflexus salis]GGE07425.1 peptidyl-prolyl cis-trans isomerase [Psychroflexus salis]